MTMTATRPIELPIPITPGLLVELEAELERRRALRAPDIAPHLTLVDLPGHKLNVLTQSVRHIFLKGGRGSAKSWAVAELLIKLTRISPLRILCTREYQNSIADSVHKLLCDTITRLGLDDWFHVTEKSIKSKSGAEFIFKGLHNNVKEIKSTEGVDICWVEEGQTITKESLKFLLPTIRKAGSRLIFTYNPENDDDPIHKMALNPPPDSITVHVNFDENPYFSKELEELRQYYLAEIDNAETDADRAEAQSDYDHVWLGETKKINNEIIFSGKYVVQDFPDDLCQKAERLLFGADFGFSQDPSTLIRGFILDKCLYIEHEAYGVGVELNEMDQFYESVPGSKLWPIKADNSRPETISHMRGFGFNCQAADKWQGSVEDGIAHIRAFKKVIIHTRCKHVAQEAKQYKYKKDRITGEVLPIIIDKHNHCIAKGELVETARGLIPIEDVVAGDYVMTRIGMQRVQSSWMASPDRELWELKAGDYTLNATPDHEVFTVNRGFVRMDALRYTDDVLIFVENRKWLSNLSVSYFKEKSLDAIRTAKIFLTGFITSALQGKDCQFSCIGQSTNISMDQFQKDVTFITRMKIKTITIFQILNALRLKSISNNTNGAMKEKQSMPYFLKRSGHSQRHGTRVMKALQSTGALVRFLTKHLCQLIKNVRIAKNHSKLKSQDILISSVPTLANQLGAVLKDWTTSQQIACPASKTSLLANIQNKKLVPARVHSICAKVKRSPVFDLAVENQHEFVVSGILVSNCWDAIRYMLDGYIQRRGDLGIWAKLGKQS